MRVVNRMNFLKSVLFFVLIFIFLVADRTIAKAEESLIVDLNGNEEVEMITPYYITTGSEADFSKYSSYGISIQGNINSFVVPIKIEYKGFLYYDYFDDGSYNMDMGIYKDPACIAPIEYDNYSGIATFDEEGIYYVKFSNISETTLSEDYLFVFDCFFIEGGDKTLKNKKWQASALMESNKPLYYKVVVNKTGMIRLEVDNYETTYVTLCNSKKVELSEECIFYKTYSSSEEDKYAVFAVKKGTYYVKVEAKSSYLRVKSTLTVITDTSGSSRKKATNLKIDTEKRGLLLSEDKTSKYDWFTFKLTKETKLNLIVEGNVSSGKIKFEIISIHADGSMKRYIDEVGDHTSTQLNLGNSSSLSKGTYYIRFYKDSSETSGNYTVELVNR